MEMKGTVHSLFSNTYILLKISTVYCRLFNRYEYFMKNLNEAFSLALLLCLGLNSYSQSEPGSGYALDFDGNDYVSINHNSALQLSNAPFTIEFWAKPSLLNGNFRWVISKDFGNVNLDYLVGISASNEWRFIARNLSIDISNPVPAVVNQWYHVACVFNGSTATLYVNGIVVGTDNTVGSAQVNTANVLIGRRNAGGQYFVGDIDEMRIWDQALTQNQIRDWMCKKLTSSHPAYSNLTAYYKFDEGSGTTLIDSDGGYNGSLLVSPTTYQLSGAAIGDESVYDYGNGNATSVIETHPDGSSFSIDNFTGTPDGGHVYLVNEAPNSNANTLSGSLEETRYYGTFVVGGSSPTYSATYDYSGNTNIDGGLNENEVRLTKRADNATTSWALASSDIDLNQNANTIIKCGESQAEYIAGFDNSFLPQRPGSGYALDFDGTNQFIDVPYSAKVNSNVFTISCWARVEGGAGSYRGVVSSRKKNVGGTLQTGFVIYANPSNEWEFWLGDGVTAGGSGWSVLNSGVTVTSEWTHIACTYDGTTQKIFINGEEKASQPSPNYTPNVDLNMRIGGVNAESQFYFNGEIDEVEVWNIALTQNQVRDRMCKKIKSDDALFCNLMAYYRFDENSGSTLTDYAGGNDGTLINGPVYQLSGAPIGDESAYDYSGTPNVSLSSADGDQLTVNSFTGTPTGAHVYLVNETPNTLTGSQGVGGNEKYFGVHKIGDNAATYTATYNYGNNPLVDGSELSLVLYSRSNNSITTWSDAVATLDANANDLTVTGQSTEYLLGSSGNPLPVELLSFDCELWNENQVKLSWQTAIEINNDFFTIERSADGSTWSEIKNIEGAGNSVDVLNYNTIDEKPLPGLSYYRLKQTDFDGTFSYSELRTVSIEGVENAEIFIYPNPTDGKLLIEGSAIELESVKVYNHLGAEIKILNLENARTDNKLTLDLSQLPYGVYLVKTKSFTQKVLKY